MSSISLTTLSNRILGRQLRKIEAQLADAKRPWAYVDAIARRMFGVARVGFCDPSQLGKIIAALAIDAKRRGVGR